MKIEIIEALQNLRWGKYLPEEVVSDQIIDLIKSSLPEAFIVKDGMKRNPLDFIDGFNFCLNQIKAKLV